MINKVFRSFLLIKITIIPLLVFSSAESAWGMALGSKLTSWWIARTNIPDPTRVRETPDEFQKRTAWWQDAKLGLFIHWGLYSIPADHTTWLGMKSYAEFYKKNKGMSSEDYRKFTQEFDAEEFDAGEWVSLAKMAGMKYIVYVAKHIDGFAMYKSELTNFNVVDATPFNRDPLRELAKACKSAGLRLGIYFNLNDWNWDEKKDRSFDLFRLGQVHELMTQYGQIDIAWFDRGWMLKPTPEFSVELVQMVRSLQPGILINNRTLVQGDFDTPEQYVEPKIGQGRLREDCMTMNDNWGYSKNDHNWKSRSQIIQALSKSVVNGGNYLLNVGPTKTGKFPRESVALLTEVGNWMKVNGQSVYGTRPCGIDNLGFVGGCTQKDNFVFLHVVEWPESGLRVKGLSESIIEARTLLGNERLNTVESEEGVSVSRPRILDPAVTVVELTVSRR